MQLKRYDENTIKNKGEKVYTEYLKLIKSGNIQVGLEVALDNLKMNRTKFISILMQYIERQDEADDYSRVFAELLSSSDPRQYLKDNNIPADFLSSNLNNYLYYKRPDILFGNKNILKILNSLIEYNNKLWREREKEIKDKETILPFVENIIQEFLNQDYSLERFCIQKNIGKNLLNPSDGYYIRELALYNKELYQKFIDDITIRESNKNKTIQDDIYKILTMLKDNINLDSIDFYLATKYGPVEFIEKAEAI